MAYSEPRMFNEPVISNEPVIFTLPVNSWMLLNELPKRLLPVEYAVELVTVCTCRLVTVIADAVTWLNVTLLAELNATPPPLLS